MATEYWLPTSKTDPINDFLRELTRFLTVGKKKCYDYGREKNRMNPVVLSWGGGMSEHTIFKINKHRNKCYCRCVCVDVYIVHIRVNACTLVY